MRTFLTGRWIASHIFVAALIISFIAAGLWQINRLQERQQTNGQIEERMVEEPVELSVLIDLPADEVEYRIVEMTGEYSDREVAIANRSDDGQPGSWVWTLFRSDSGAEILVNRGFVSRPIMQESEAAVPLEETFAPTGSVTVEGRLRQGIDSGRLSESGSELSRPDAALAAKTLEITTALDPELYVELISQNPPATGAFPRPLPAPDLGEGPHRSYAFQWFTFATLGLVGYGLVLRRIRRGDQARGDVPHHLD